MLNSLANRERADAWEVDANIKLRAAMILHWMRVYAISFEAPRYYNELVVNCDNILSRFAFPVKLDDFLFQL